MGEILVRRGVLARSEIDRALRAQGQLLLPIASTLLKMGSADEPLLVSALAEHYGVPGVDLGASVIATSVLNSIPSAVARAHHLLPLSSDPGALPIVVADPGRQDILDELAFATGRAMVAMVSLQMRIDDAIDAAYAARERGDAVFRGDRATSDELHLEILTPLGVRDNVSLDVEIPAEHLAALAERPIEPLPRKGTRARVLAVDDEPEILELIDRALGSRDIEVIRASRGGEVIDLVEAESPDVVLLDAMLPEVQGFELCTRIKQSPRYQHIPVLIVSAMASGWNFAQDVRRLYGADGFMAKPFRIAELLHWVEEALERTRARPRSPQLEQAHKVASHECKRAAELYKGGDLPGALDAAHRAVGADPFDPRAHFVLGTVLNASGEVYRAISQYERVAELAPTLFSALKNLAVLYERQGFQAKAVEMWTRALEQSPSDAVRKTIKAHLIGLL